MVSFETARRLMELGYSQNLKVGDYYWATFAGKHWPALVTEITLNKDRAPQRWGYPPTKRGPKLLHLDQVLEEIRKQLPGCLIKFAEIPSGIHCWIETVDNSTVWADGPNDTEAAGQVLVKILEVQCQRK